MNNYAKNISTDNQPIGVISFLLLLVQYNSE